MNQREIAKKHNYQHIEVQIAVDKIALHKPYFGLNKVYSKIEENAIVIYLKTFLRTKNEKFAVTAAIEYLKEREITEVLLKSMDISKKHGLLP